MYKDKIAVIGLGYVGLPLAIAFAEKYYVKGFDINSKRISELKKGIDYTGEAESELIGALVRNTSENKASTGLFFTENANEIADCKIYIITVPTPVDNANLPDLRLLKQASQTVGKILKKGDIVVYESTVYPGCTEEIAVPILEEISGLVYNEEFYCGYSPERINPGDKQRTISKITKVTSGSTPEIAEKIDKLYASVITAGTYKAPSIKIAEAAKVIENAQRDINIAFMNELSKIFHLLEIDTQEVLKAASTKWNFLNFQPGLVGGHCIGVDPYYLAEKAKSVGYIPELILAARKMNDSMGDYVAKRVADLMAKKGTLKKGAEVLIMGITFKENFADIRNSKVIDILHSLEEYHLNVTLFDPIASSDVVKEVYGYECLNVLEPHLKFSAIIVAVNHAIFKNLDIVSHLDYHGILFDVKGGVNNSLVNSHL